MSYISTISLTIIPRTNAAGSIPSPLDMSTPSHPLEDSSPTQLKLKSLDDEILSGTYGDEGSTKARLVRPLRKLLAKDRIGPGLPLVFSQTGLTQGVGGGGMSFVQAVGLCLLGRKQNVGSVCTGCLQTWRGAVLAAGQLQKSYVTKMTGVARAMRCKPPDISRLHQLRKLPAKVRVGPGLPF